MKAEADIRAKISELQIHISRRVPELQALRGAERTLLQTELSMSGLVAMALEWVVNDLAWEDILGKYHCSRH